ncbi:saccharopine dehydrogenase [Micromonospora sp. NPDC048947]|uniref:saccharopine dehydrogenase n=1 Tax=Micromonospora sp. NPDC048947 TaxID=3154826 RepID=UPI0034107C5A
MSVLELWLREEINPDEHRTVLTPDDARVLIADGVRLTVEESAHRIFDTGEYAAAGARIVAAGTWPEASAETVIVGLKAPADEPEPLRHRHIFFGHAYKGQRDGAALLRRFRAGGTLLDLEYLTDDSGRRVAAFGYWAGYVGAALALLHFRGRLVPPLRTMSRPELDEALVASGNARVRALVIGALGRCGRGARDALSVGGVEPTAWDVAETRDLDRRAILDHDVLVNTVLSNELAPPFVRPEDLDDPARTLSVISDVTCDVTSEFNLLPIYRNPTDWARPVHHLRAEPALDLLAIDNLPSLLPREASAAFSADLLPHLRTLPDDTPVWRRAYDRFAAATSELDLMGSPS